MGRNERRRQKAIEKKKAKRKEKAALAASHSVATSPGSALRQGPSWPLHDVLLSSGWKENRLAQIVVSRSAPSGAIAAAVFLVDTACLGIKDTFVSRFGSAAEYRERMLARFPTDMERVGLDFAAKIIRESVAYARRLGFQPSHEASK